MQKQRVVSWLSQHNFPQGMVFFSEGLVHDPLRQKTLFLKSLVKEVCLCTHQPAEHLHYALQYVALEDDFVGFE